MLCPGCLNRNNELLFNWLCYFAAAETAIGIGTYQKNSVFSYCVIFLGVFYFTQILSIFPHEAGHALVAWAVGLRVFTVNIGNKGGVWFIRQVFGCDVIVYRIQESGSVNYTPKSLKFVRVRRLATILAGPSANIVMAIGAGFLFQSAPQHSCRQFVLATVFYSCLFVIANNMLPRKVTVGGKRIPSDGLYLLTLPFSTRKYNESLHSAWFFLEALESLERNHVEEAEKWLAKGIETYPENTWKALVQEAILYRRRRYVECRIRSIATLEVQSSDPLAIAVQQNNIAWYDLMLYDSALMDEADRLSETALAASPGECVFRVTRGCVLIELGRIDGGIPLVKQGFHEAALPEIKALAACYLAIAYCRQGDRAESNRWLATAERLDRHGPLIERAQNQVKAGGGQPLLG